MTKKEELKLTLENPPQYAVGDEYLGLTDEIKKQESDIKNIGGFKGTYSEQIDKKVADYLGRDKFNFNPNNSSTYQQIRNQYLGDGKRAMEDTLASGAQLSGGYNNSAAQVAAQQTYNDYVKGVTDYIPKLEAEAYERHLNEGNQMLADINLMKGLDDSEYGKYIDDLNQKYQMLSHLTGMQQNYANLDANKNNFNQGNWSTILGAQQNAAMHEDDMAIDERNFKQDNINNMLNNLMSFAQYGISVKVPEEITKATGVTQEMFDNLVAKANTPTVSNSGGVGAYSDDEPEVKSATKEDIQAFEDELLQILNESGADAAGDWALGLGSTKHSNLSDENIFELLNYHVMPVIEKEKKEQEDKQKVINKINSMKASKAK